MKHEFETLCDKLNSEKAILTDGLFCLKQNKQIDWSQMYH
jgi:hypothetical protein